MGETVSWAEMAQEQTQEHTPDAVQAAGAEPRVLFGPEPEPPSPLQRAQMFCDLGRFAEAVAAASALISEDPRSPAAWCVMAQAQLGADRAEAALKAAEAAASLDPGLEHPHRLASLALNRLGREREATEAAEEATRREPDSWQAHAHLAHCLAAVGERLDDARGASERALTLGPGESGPHMAAGTVALAAGRQAEATSAFCAALAADPQCPEAHSRLAEVPTRGSRPAVGTTWSRIRQSLSRLPRPTARRRRR